MNVSNKVLLICTVFNRPKELKETIHCIEEVVSNRTDSLCVIIDNNSKDKESLSLLKTIKNEKILIIQKKENHGKAMATNQFISEYLSETNCPRIVISLDPDVKFHIKSFNKLIYALDTIPKLGMLGMRYKNNEHNPERNIIFPAKKFRVNNNEFSISIPFLANVAGPLFGIQGYVLSHYLNFKLFPKSKNELNIKKGYIQRAGSDDAYLYDHLKKHKLIQGYLNGTEIEHLKSGPQEKHYIK